MDSAPAFSLCVSLCSLLQLGKLVLILLCFIQPCKQLTCVCLGCFNLLLFSFLCLLPVCSDLNPLHKSFMKHQLLLNLFCFPCCLPLMPRSLSDSQVKSGSRRNCCNGWAGAREVREVAVLTDRRPLWWHQTLVPVLPARASGGGELASLVFGVPRGQAVPHDRHRHLLMHDLMFAFTHLETVMQSAGWVLSEEETLWLLKSNPLGISFPSYYPSPPSSAL